MAFLPRPRFLWQTRTRSLELGQRTLVMGIVNLTPDSFSGDGLSQQGIDEALAHAAAQLDAGADILDLGAESTRPNAAAISPEEEQQRLLPALEAILRERADAVVSIDTYHASTARAAAALGAEIINDVSGLSWDEAMPAAVAASGCGLVLMHTRGRPTEWGSLPPLSCEQVLPLVVDGLTMQLAIARAAGIAQQQIVLDPGFGFGKRGAENFTLLAGLHELQGFDLPLLIGLSRKGFLGGANAAERLPATIAANVASILNGAHLIRVHDVREAREAANIADALLAKGS
ncbi:dihydropteroate synthase [Granulicella cerasi]|uniref:dihydropteroate synthase n=1 Tax=Granulicella cerasi TaxID=741063 RepID=UPI0021DFD326|nr:dihydropteroate synthase [Granulicella cerasi]